MSLHATKVIDASDNYLPAHFPGFTIFPGVFIIEAVWQAVMIGVRESIGLRPAVEKVVSVRFLAPLFPRDSVTLDVSVGPMSAPGPLDAAAVCRRHDGTVVARVKLQLRRGGADGA